MSPLADLPLMRPHTLYLLPGGTLTFGSTRPAHRASKGQRAWGYTMLTVAVSLLAQFFLKLLLRSGPRHCQEGSLHSPPGIAAFPAMGSWRTWRRVASSESARADSTNTSADLHGVT